MTYIHENAHYLSRVGQVLDKEPTIGAPSYKGFIALPQSKEESGDQVERIIWNMPNAVKGKENNPNVEGIESNKYKVGVTEQVVDEANQTEEGKKTLVTPPQASSSSTQQ